MLSITLHALCLHHVHQTSKTTLILEILRASRAVPLSFQSHLLPDRHIVAIISTHKRRARTNAPYASCHEAVRNALFIPRGSALCTLPLTPTFTPGFFRPSSSWSCSTSDPLLSLPLRTPRLRSFDMILSAAALFATFAVAQAASLPGSTPYLFNRELAARQDVPANCVRSCGPVNDLITNVRHTAYLEESSSWTE